MIKAIIIIFVLLISGCSESHRYEEFISKDPAMGEEAFRTDSALCEREKDRYSNKIQGREFGFKGADTGYLGCMKLRGWDKK